MSESTAVDTPVTPAGDSKGDSGGDGVKTYTADEVENILSQRLRGQGKELKKTQEELARYREAEEEAKRKDLEAKGEYQTLIAEKTEEVDRYRAEVEKFRKQESERLELVEASNKERVDNLPDLLKDLVPEALSPDDKSAYLSKLEARATELRSKGDGLFGARPRVAEAKTEEQEIQDLLNKGRDRYLGKG